MKEQYKIKDITTPKAGFEVFKDSYWLCEEGDPKRALFYGKSPQCNRNKAIMERVLKLSPDSMQIVFVESAFVPARN